ncbi:hypothetical protein PAPYR_10893 [Paratrimastix pyriformis]|uniref:Secreted protein n=1 Tax=Paratrimastix pyriformis TaxID=342808 RepID=A0ABQ8U9Y5_9EUKA|nr:hypothetical protein PAPYR_10893 [Paratrimastix pyriformis]
MWVRQFWGTNEIDAAVKLSCAELLRSLAFFVLAETCPNRGGVFCQKASPDPSGCVVILVLPAPGLTADFYLVGEVRVVLSVFRTGRK